HPKLTAGFRPRPNSPAINDGDNAAPAVPALDLSGQPRLFGPTVDLGVYEFQGITSGPDPSTSFQINRTHSGQQLVDTISRKPTHQWTVDLHGSVSYPVIAQGLVFVTSIYAEGFNLWALSQATGAVVWGPIGLTGAYDW